MKAYRFEMLEFEDHDESGSYNIKLNLPNELFSVYELAYCARIHCFTVSNVDSKNWNIDTETIPASSIPYLVGFSLDMLKDAYVSCENTITEWENDPPFAAALRNGWQDRLRKDMAIEPRGLEDYLRDGAFSSGTDTSSWRKDLPSRLQNIRTETVLNAFCLYKIDRALVAIDDNKNKLALELIADAGLAHSSASTLWYETINELMGRDLDPTQNTKIIKTFETYGSIGGRIRAMKYEPLKEFALNLYGQKTYKNPRHASRCLKRSVLAVADKKNIRVKKENFERTIYHWILEDNKKR